MSISERIRCWIIEKLGGYPNQTKAIVYNYQSLPIVFVEGSVPLPDEIFRTDNPKKDYITKQEIAERIGRYIVDNDLYEAEYECDFTRYSVKIVDVKKNEGLIYDNNRAN